MAATLVFKPFPLGEILDLFSMCCGVLMCDSTSISFISVEQMLQRILNG